MKGNIYDKLSRMRESLKKEHYTSFSDFLTAVDKKAKYYKVLPLYCFYDSTATLTIVDMDNIAMCLKFQIPVDIVGFKGVKQYLYSMAFEVEIGKGSITPIQYVELTERMKELNVSEKEVLERYKIKKLVDMDTETFKRCMTALENMRTGSSAK